MSVLSRKQEDLYRELNEYDQSGGRKRHMEIMRRLEQTKNDDKPNVKRSSPDEDDSYKTEQERDEDAINQAEYDRQRNEFPIEPRSFLSDDEWSRLTPDEKKFEAKRVRIIKMNDVFYQEMLKIYETNTVLKDFLLSLQEKYGEWNMPKSGQNFYYAEGS
ncbi:hypothetical protein GUITHDRAFT_101230 [Guillardia theta CCMP2712]|uniref:Uncharacterized protein n=1 Tax=Guillardia theta (strain CCMP2712) TaxID=905079 RepID=L1JX66_GUITC|nr:hypothetical protein GUITHDRAFT_101230 [Guillardia theta CCMP2712]EKX52780.1 hypothetical protein GUITHDRAFT_101230 [Guillardia theta CCMP2712]|eukprot:XP_005839760.1 hypothetical protein GUITHDRAFT_101230 [Guillardia theta CCMP2712]